MGLFDLFKKAAPKEEPPAVVTVGDVSKQDKCIELYEGMKIEVLTMANHLMFVARLEFPENGIFQLHKVSDDPIRLNFNDQVKLKCYQKNSETSALTATVSATSGEFIRVENLEILQSLDGRAFFRQSIERDGKVITASRYKSGEKVPCKVLDISAGGVRLVMAKRYEMGDVFLLEMELLPTEEKFSLTCQVRRVVESQKKTDTHPAEYDYGCQFVGLRDTEQQRLLQAIFVVQRKMLQGGR